MLNKDTKKRIDDARDTLVGVLPLPTDQIELITIALIYKFMDDQDEELRLAGFDEKFFKGSLREYSWQHLMSNQISVDQRVTKFINGIEQIQKAPDIPTLFKEIFQNAFLKFRDGKVLQRFLDIINGFTYNHSEELGNAFEYLLMTMGAQGDNGQFRTPRNIIDFIVDVVNPQKTDTILDPACGTGGFLVSAYKHIMRTNTKGYEDTRFTTNGIDEEKINYSLGDLLSTEDRKNIEKNIAGYDNTPLMVRLARVNLYLHHFNNPKIHEYNTLITDTRWKDRFDCILANPPFMTPKGGIDPHDKFRIPANRTEVLFSSYILQHLNAEKGKAGFIVPEGIIFTNINDYVKLREWLLYEAGLWAVVSLPAGVFQPYSGVKTSILFIDKEIARNRSEVLLVKIENDGYSLNTNRNEIDNNDLPEALRWLDLCKKNKEQFISELNEQKESPFSKKLQLLHRDEFAKLDAYKSSSSAFAFIIKQYNSTIKLIEEYKEKQQEQPDKANALQEKINKKVQDFHKITGLNHLPQNKETLKIWFDENLKESAIKYGTTQTNTKLPIAIKEHLDNQREFNIGFDKYLVSDELINSNYPIVKLKDVLKIQTGFPFNSELFNTNKVGFPIIRIRDIKKGYTETYYKGEFDDSFIVNQGEILIGMDGEFKAFKWGKQPALLNQRVCRLHSFEMVLEDYVFRFLNEELLKIEQKTLSVTVKHISHNQIYTIEIPLPPLEIQQKIVSEIEQYQKVIDGCDLLIENYKPNLEIQQNWDIYKLGDLCTIIRGSSPRPAGDLRYYGGTIPRLMVADVTRDGMYVTPKIDYLTPEGALLSRPMKKGELVMAVSGNPGLCSILEVDACIHDGFAGFKDFDPNLILIEYAYFILSDLGEHHNKQSEGAIFKNLKTDHLRNFEIPLPKIEEQKIIVDSLLREKSTITGAKELKAKMQQKISEAINKVWGK